jgi:hypothetical protein
MHVEEFAIETATMEIKYARVVRGYPENLKSIIVSYFVSSDRVPF